MMTVKTARSIDSTRQESFLMECFIKPVVKKLSGWLVTVLMVIALVTYVGNHFPSLFPQHVTESEITIEEKLQAIGELATFEKTKTGEHTWGAARKVPYFGWDMPFTYTDLTIRYDSIIKIGYYSTEIKATEVDDKSVIVTLPEAKVLSNTVEITSVDYNLSAFNDPPYDKVTELIEEAKAKELKAVEELGCYQMAKDEAVRQITAFLTDLGYENIDFR